MGQASIVTIPHTIPDRHWAYTSPAVIEDTTAVAVKAASTGYKHRVCAIQLCNADASVDTMVQLLDHETVIWQGLIVHGQPPVAVNFDIPLVVTVSKALNVKCVTTSAEVYVNVQGFTAP